MEQKWAKADPTLLSKGALEDDYTVGKLLGKGAYSEVYRCTHKKSNMKRAVKRTRKDHPEYDPVRICAA